MLINTLSITCDLPIMTFWTSAAIADAIAPTALRRSRTSGVLWCFGWAGAAGAAGATGAAGAAGAMGMAGAGGATGAAGAAGAGAGGAAGGAGGCMSIPPCFNYPNDVCAGSIPVIHRWRKHGLNSQVQPIWVPAPFALFRRVICGRIRRASNR